MKKANSTDPAKFTPEMFNISFTGSTGKVEFDAKGDRKDAEMTIFRMGKDGKIVPVAIVKNGVSTPFGAPAPAAAAPAAAAPAAAAAAAPAPAPMVPAALATTPSTSAPGGGTSGAHMP